MIHLASVDLSYNGLDVLCAAQVAQQASDLGVRPWKRRRVYRWRELGTGQGDARLLQDAMTDAAAALGLQFMGAWEPTLPGMDF